MKKTIAILICILMVISILSACSSQKSGSSQAATTASSANGEIAVQTPKGLNPTGYPIMNEKIKLKMMGKKAAIQGSWDQLLFFQELEKKTNIAFEFDTPSADVYNEKKNLAFASGNLPDLFFSADLSSSDEATYGGQNMLIPLEKYIDQYALNLKGLMDKDKNIKPTISNNGHIYSLPNINELKRDLIPSKLWINNEWLSNVGLKIPSTVDELYTVLKAFKEKDPNKNGKDDEIPISTDTASTFSQLKIGLLCAYGLIHNNNKMDVKNDKLIYVPIQEGYKEYLRFMNKLYTEKLLDQESFSQTSQQLVAKGNDLKVGVFAHAAPYLVAKMDDYPKFDAIPPLKSSLNQKQIWPITSSIQKGAFAITNKNKYPEASIRWVDFLYTKEGAIFRSQGPEGIGWKWSNNEKTQWEKILPSGYSNTEEFRGAKITPQAGGIIPGKTDPDFSLKMNAPHVLALEKSIAQAYTPYLVDAMPNLTLTEDEQKQITAIEADLNKYVLQTEVRFITGDMKFDAWDVYVNTVKKMRTDELVKIYQASYDRWKNVK